MKGENAAYHMTEQMLENEQQIIMSAQKDSRNFEPLYNKYHEQIFRYVYQRLDSIDEAKDITSKVFLKALTQIKKYEYRGVPFSSWLYRIAYSELNQSFRDAKASRTVNLTDQSVTEMELFETNGITEAQLSLLTECLAEISKTDLELIEFRYFEKRSVREVALILSISESNVKVKTHRAIKQLKDLFFKKIATYETH